MPRATEQQAAEQVSNHVYMVNRRWGEQNTSTGTDVDDVYDVYGWMDEEGEERMGKTEGYSVEECGGRESW